LSVHSARLSLDRLGAGALLFRILTLLVGCLGLIWGISNVATGAASDSFLDLEASLLRFETFNRDTAIGTLNGRAAQNASPCDAHAQRALLLLELPLADAALRSGSSQDFDQHNRSLEERARKTLLCSPRDSLVWLLLFGLKNEHGLLDEETFNLLAMSYETSPYEAWVAIRRIVVAIPVILAAPVRLRERVLVEFQALIQLGFLEAPALAYRNASDQVRSLLQSRVDQLGAARQAEFRRAVERLKP
jgi:hypothetical protein